MVLSAIIKVQEDTAEIWGISPVAIDEAFMRKVKVHSDLFEGLKPENAVDLQKTADGESLVFSFHDGRKVRVFSWEAK